MTRRANRADHRELFKALCAEARDLMKRLEGSSVQRVTVEPTTSRSRSSAAVARHGRRAGGPSSAAGRDRRAARGSPGARAASGSSPIGPSRSTTAIPVLAPLVGTFYKASAAGREAVRRGRPRRSSAGDTVCIVEAMKLMNEVAASEGGRSPRSWSRTASGSSSSRC